MKTKFFAWMVGFLIVYTAAFQFLPAGTTPRVLAEDMSVESAANRFKQGTPVDISEPQKIFDILSRIVRWTYTIFFIVAVFFVLLAAYNYLFSQGDPTKVKSARSQILWAAVAIAVALISVGASQIIASFLKNA